MERRKRHRVHLGERSDVEVTLLAPGREPIAGRLFDVTVDGTGVRVRRERGPALAVGVEAQLVLSGPRFMKPLTVRGRLRNRTTEEAFHRYGFEFTEKDGDDETLLAEAFHTLFDRRRAARVRPDPALPVDVALQGDAPEAKGVGTIADLSTDGLAVLVDLEAESRLADAERVRLSFRLPGCEEDFEFVALLIHRHLRGSQVRYGLFFREAETHDFLRQKAAIDAWVRRRREETLRVGVQ